MKRCVNIKNKEFKELEKESGLSPFSLEYIIYKYQKINDTDNYPTLEYVQLMNNPEFKTLSSELDIKANNIYSAMDNFNSTLMYFNNTDKTIVDNINIENAVRTHLAKIKGNTSVRIEYVNDRNDDFKTRLSNDILYVNLSAINNNTNLNELSQPLKLRNPNKVNPELLDKITEVSNILESEHKDLIENNSNTSKFINNGPVIILENGNYDILHSDELQDSLIYKFKNKTYLFYSEDQYQDLVDKYGSIDKAINADDSSLVSISTETKTGKIVNNIKSRELQTLNTDILSIEANDNNISTINNLLHQINGGVDSSFDKNSDLYKGLKDISLMLNETNEGIVSNVEIDRYTDENQIVEGFKAKDGSLFKTDAERSLYERKSSEIDYKTRHSLFNKYLNILDSGNVSLISQNGHVSNQILNALEDNKDTVFDKVIDLYSFAKEQLPTFENSQKSFRDALPLLEDSIGALEGEITNLSTIINDKREELNNIEDTSSKEYIGLQNEINNSVTLLNQNTLDLSKLNSLYKRNNLKAISVPTKYKSEVEEQIINKYVGDIHKQYNHINKLDEALDTIYSNLRGDAYSRELETNDVTDRKIAILQKTLNVHIIKDPNLQNRGALLSSNHPLTKKFGIPVIILNPDILLSDTVFHEFGHLYIELLGGLNDPKVAQAINKLKFTDFHYEMLQRYPELQGEDFDKELLATALGMEADKLFERNLTDLVWWQKFINGIKDYLSKIFSRAGGIDSDLIIELANEMLSGNTRHASDAVYQSKINLYSKYEIKTIDENNNPIEVNMQEEAIKLFEKLRNEIRTDFEDGKHDYIKNGDIINNPSISTVSKKIAKSGKVNRVSGNKGSIDLRFDRRYYDKDSMLMEIGKTIIPLSLAKALDDFMNNNIPNVPRNFTLVDNPKNWKDQYLNEIVDQTKTNELDGLVGMLQGNLGLPMSGTVKFRDEILNYLDDILDRAEEIQARYDQASIVGNSLHKAFEDIVNGDIDSLPNHITDETDGELLKALLNIVSQGTRNGSKFFSEQVVWDNDNNRAGTSDLIEITKDGEFRIYDYKTIKSFQNNEGTNLTDKQLYVHNGYMHQTLAYGNILKSYGLIPAENAYNIILINTEYSNVTNQSDPFTVKDFKIKSMEDENLNDSYHQAMKIVNREFRPKINLSDINNKSEIENIGDVTNKINQVMNLFRSKLVEKTKGIEVPNFQRILDDLKKEADLDFIAEYNKYGAKQNKVILLSFIDNIHDTLVSLNDTNGDNISPEYLMGLNYILQVSDTLVKVQEVVANKVALEKEGINESDAVELIQKMDKTIDMIAKTKDFYKTKAKELSIYLLSKGSNFSEGRIKEILEREARKKGITDKDGINNYIYQNISKRKSDIESMEISYWTAQYDNGILDLRTFERYLADPGMIKSQFIQVVKNMMDANDMNIRKQIMTLAPEIEDFYNQVKTRNPKGGTHKQWSRFINKSDVYVPENGKVENMMDGTLISEFTSDYADDKLKSERIVNNLLYEKKHILSKNTDNSLSPKDVERLDEIQTLIKEEQDRFYKQRIEGAKKENYRKAKTNPLFQKLSKEDQESLRYIHNTLRNSDDVIDDLKLKLTQDLGDNVIIYTLPKQRMGYHEAVSNSSATAQFVSSLKDIYRPASDDTELNVTDEEYRAKKDDTEFSNVNTDVDGNSLFSIPLWYRNELEDPRLQSYDLPTLLLENHLTSLNYKQGIELEADLFIIQESLNDANGANVVKTDGFVSDKLKDKTGNIFQKSTNNNLYKALKSSIDNRLYKRPYVGNYTRTNYMYIKGIEKLTRYSSLNSLSLNFKSALATSSQGGIFRLIEGMIGEYFDMNDWKNGTTKTYADMLEVMKDGQRHIPQSKTNLLLKHFGLEQNAKVLVNKFVQDNFAKKNLDTDSLYAVTAIAEKTVTSMLMYSLLNNIKVMNNSQEYLDKDGKVTSDKKKAMSLDEAYDIKDGKLVLKPNVVYTTNSLINKYNDKGNDAGVAATEISKYIQDVYADLYGQYNDHLKSELQRTVLGKMIMSMKGWLPRGLHRRFRGITSSIPIKQLGFLDYEQLHNVENLDKRFYSQAKKQFQEGYFTSLLRYTGSIIHHTQRKNLGIIGAGKDVWNNLNTHERANIKRAGVEMAIMVSLTTLTMLMTAIAKGFDDEEDTGKKERIYMLAYMSYRINDELTTFVNPKSFLNMISNPAASFNTFNSIWKLLKRMIEVEYDGDEFNWTINDRYEKGAKQDELKVYHDALKLVNPINQVKQVGSIFGYDTGKTIEDSYKGQMLANEM